MSLTAINGFPVLNKSYRFIPMETEMASVDIGQGQGYLTEEDEKIRMHTILGADHIIPGGGHRLLYMPVTRPCNDDFHQMNASFLL